MTASTKPPGEVAAEGRDEHLAQLFAPGFGDRHRADEGERHEQAEEHFRNPVHRTEQRLAAVDGEFFAHSNSLLT
jgi:anti-sigma-K factor RskA